MSPRQQATVIAKSEKTDQYGIIEQGRQPDDS